MFNLAFLLFSSGVLSQTKSKTKSFTVQGQIQNKDTGRILLWYYDEFNKFQSDTQFLKHGRFIFKGTTNRVCEGMLWTNLENKNFGDHSVIRFLLEPKNIIIKYNKDSILIKGSKPQIEKQNWDYLNNNLIKSKFQYRKIADSLYQQSKINNNYPYQKTIVELYKKIDSVNILIKLKDINYIESNPNSYLSGYLLKIHNRKMNIDSLKNFYSLLSENVKKSSIGYNLLEIIYPLTNDKNFRKLNPLLGDEFDKKLNTIKNLYDFSLKNLNGENVDFSSFKGKFIVLDFWASWCGPCLANIPSQKLLIKKYNGSPLEFVSISLDTDKTKWKKTLKKYDLDGVQLNAPKAFNELIAIYFKVLAPPQYVIIDKDGMVVNQDAPQPLDPELEKILDTLLK